MPGRDPRRRRQFLGRSPSWPERRARAPQNKTRASGHTAARRKSISQIGHPPSQRRRSSSIRSDITRHSPDGRGSQAQVVTLWSSSQARNTTKRLLGRAEVNPNDQIPNSSVIKTQPLPWIITEQIKIAHLTHVSRGAAAAAGRYQRYGTLICDCRTSKDDRVAAGCIAGDRRGVADQPADSSWSSVKLW